MKGDEVNGRKKNGRRLYRPSFDQIGHKEVILGENTKAAKEERYLCCYSEQALVFEKLTDGLVSEDTPKS
jgi:hypothetical protein